MESNADRSFFGHPRGLATLFFTEMWERFSYYGIRAILLYFMTAAAAKGGLGFVETRASAVIGMFLGSVYLLSLVGGWIADRILGMKLSVFWGGVGIAVGNALVAVPGVGPFYSGLVLIALGTGLLKPNVSTLVGTLYAPEDARRDAGFSIYYMGINLGAFIAPLVCGYLGQVIDFRLGFAAAAVGMVAGLVQYVLGWRNFGPGAERPTEGPESRSARRILWGGLALVVIAAAGVAGANSAGFLPLSVEGVSDVFGLILILTVMAVFGYLLLSPGWSRGERNRLLAIFGLFCASTIFWSLFEQAASTLSLFADRNSDNQFFGWTFPSSFYQTLNSLFIISFAPVFGWLWTRLGRYEPSVPAKFSFGLVGAALGYAVLIPAAAMTAGGNKVTPWFLVLTYLLHTFGELCLSPVGLSAMTRLAPAGIGSFVMGVWFMSISAGNYLAGRVSGFYTQMSLQQLFGTVALAGFAVAALIWLVRKPLDRLATEG
jgi:POT family proton-dependent oligopeptide transporter